MYVSKLRAIDVDNKLSCRSLSGVKKVENNNWLILDLLIRRFGQLARFRTKRDICTLGSMSAVPTLMQSPTGLKISYERGESQYYSENRYYLLKRCFRWLALAIGGWIAYCGTMSFARATTTMRNMR